jgi:hypothetical protein
MISGYSENAILALTLSGILFAMLMGALWLVAKIEEGDK